MPEDVQEKKSQSAPMSQTIIAVAAGFVIIFSIRYIAQDIVAPILMAIFLAILLTPLFRRFRHRGFSKNVSVLFTILTVIVVGVLLTIFLTWSFSLLGDYIYTATSELQNSINGAVDSTGIETESVTGLLNGVTPEAIFGAIASVLGRVGGIVVYFVLVPILAVLMLSQADMMEKNILETTGVPGGGIEKFKSFAEGTMLYVTGRLKVNIFTGVAFAAALIMLGVEFAPVWGVMTIFMSFVPYIGLVIAGIPPTLIAFTNGGVSGALLVIVAITIINLAAENILEPYIQGRGTKISTLAIIISLIFWVWLLGPVGAILSVPLTVFMKIVLADYQETAWIAAIMEGNYAEAKPDNVQSTFGSLRNKVTSRFKS